MRSLLDQTPLGCLKPALPFSFGGGSGRVSCSSNMGLLDLDHWCSFSKPCRCCRLVDVLRLRCGGGSALLFGGCGVFDADLEVKRGCVEVAREAMKW